MSDDVSSRIRLRAGEGAPEGNHRTIADAGARGEIDPTALVAAYEGATRALAEGPPLRDGHRIFWSRGRLLGATELPATEAAYKIVGRHTECDISLDADSEISLRHMVLRSVLTGQGERTLRVLDLHSALGFRLGDGVVRRSVVVRGPVAMELGGYVLVAVPAGPVPAELPDAIVEETTSPYRAPPMRPNGISHVSVLPHASEVLARPPESVRGRTPMFSLHQGAEMRSFLATDEELDQGILVGRYPTAPVHTLLDENVSRLHLLLVREDGNIFAVDLCSTNGTFVGKERIRRAQLSPGMELRLGFGVTMRWSGG